MATPTGLREGNPVFDSLFPNGEVPGREEMEVRVREVLGGQNLADINSEVLAYFFIGSALLLGERTETPPYAVAEALAASLGSPWIIEAMLADAFTALKEQEAELEAQNSGTPPPAQH